MNELEQRLIKRGTDTEDKIKERLAIAQEEIKQSKVEGFHDRIIVNDDLYTTYKILEAYVFGDEEAETVEPVDTDEAADSAVKDESAMEVDNAVKAEV